jgi:hypothetical protein
MPTIRCLDQYDFTERLNDWVTRAIECIQQESIGDVFMRSLHCPFKYILPSHVKRSSLDWVASTRP